MKKTLFLACGLLCCLTLAAQPDTLKEPQENHQFSINASHWTRGELRAGGLPNKKGDDLAVFVMSSTMLQFDYQYKGKDGSPSATRTACSSSWDGRNLPTTTSASSVPMTG